MRKGYQPSMLLDAKGRMFALATGSDATSEHEWGSKEMRTALCGMEALSAEELANKLKAKRPTLLQSLLGKKGSVDELLKELPDFLGSKRIQRNLDSIGYEERTVAGVEQAALTFSARGREERPFENKELDFSAFSEPKDIAGAWDQASFGFRVSGAKRVAQLRVFAQAVKEGKAVFAGTFLTKDGKERLSGVIIAIEELLRPEHRSAMKEAQTEFRNDVELHLRAKTAELRALAYTLKGKSFTHIWPVWQGGKVNGIGGEIAYAVNPGHGTSLPYFGPYGFDEFKSWLEAGAPEANLPKALREQEVAGA